MNRRLFLGSLLGLSAIPLVQAAPAAADSEFFIFVHANGGWDVTLWADPRNERKGIVDPASTQNTDSGLVRQWTDAPLDGDEKTFKIVQPAGCKIPFGPGIGKLVEHADRLTVINGLAMNTVSHPDGTVFSATGRHLAGGRVVASSIDTMIANELGREQTFPIMSVAFPSSFVGEGLDRRVVPLRVGSINAITRVLSRSEKWESAADRDAVTALLSQEARDLALRSHHKGAVEGLAVQYDALRKMLGGDVQQLFAPAALKSAQPGFDYKARFINGGVINAAFAVEAMKKNLVRCVGFSLGGFDTHRDNYKNQAAIQQDVFDCISDLLRALDSTPHPTRAGHKLSEHTHIMVMSEFCRTPQINVNGGRDHYPNNSALVISPRFKGNLVFGKSDPEQLLPAIAKTFADGPRPIAPPDLLSTFLSAFGIDPSRYVRDGEVVSELLA
jgi:uncharacterized protein (DUF1501 family)